MATPKSQFHFLAPASKAAKSSDKTCDHFSNLPNCIIHLILSFLRMKDIALISCLSKICKQLCLSRPNLEYNSDCYTTKYSKICGIFSSSVDKSLNQWNGLEMQSFKLTWVCHNKPHYHDELPIVNRWMKIAVRCGVQELDLEITVKEGKSYVLPRCIFSCQSLRAFKLSFHKGTLKRPSKVVVSLEVLSLNSIRIDDHSFESWISNLMPSLKKLELKDVDCVEKLSIVSSSPEHLKVSHIAYKSRSINISTERPQSLYLDVSGFSRDNPSLIIFAPNLKTLWWKGPPMYYSCGGKFDSLRDATLDLDSDHYGRKWRTASQLKKLLHSASCVRALCLDVWIVEVLFQHDKLPVVLDHLQHLVVIVPCLKDYQIPAIASFLMGCTISRL